MPPKAPVAAPSQAQPQPQPGAKPQGQPQPPQSKPSINEVYADEDRDGIPDHLEGKSKEMTKEEAIEHEKRLKDAARFKKYLHKTGLPLVFQVIYGEILTQGIDQENVFSYTAMRLRQIGNDIIQIKAKKI